MLMMMFVHVLYRHSLSMYQHVQLFLILVVTNRFLRHRNLTLGFRRLPFVSSRNTKHEQRLTIEHDLFVGFVRLHSHVD